MIPDKHSQITAASLVSREEITTGKLRVTCLRQIVSIKRQGIGNTVHHSDEVFRSYLQLSSVRCVHDRDEIRRETYESEGDG
jgi:hypothetical protein